MKNEMNDTTVFEKIDELTAIFYEILPMENISHEDFEKRIKFDTLSNQLYCQLKSIQKNLF